MRYNHGGSNWTMLAGDWKSSRAQGVLGHVCLDSGYIDGGLFSESLILSLGLPYLDWPRASATNLDGVHSTARALVRLP